MTSHYSCQTSLSEVAEEFAATPPRPTDWSPELWPGRTGLIVRESEDGRIVETMTWGVPPPFHHPRPDSWRGATFWFRQLREKVRWLLDPAQRCIIVLDSFAYPGGDKGSRTRTYYGFEDRPIFGWAGVWSDTGHAIGYGGLLVAADHPVSPGRAMPVILDRADYGAWLGPEPTAQQIALQSAPHPGMFREETERPWGADRDP